MRRPAAALRRMAGQPEAWSAVGAVLWAKWVWLQPDDLALRAPYHVLTAVADDAIWEWIGFAAGLLQLAAVAANRRWPRFAAASLAALFWLTLAYGLWLGEPSAPSASTYLTFGLCNMALSLMLCCRRS